VKASLKGFVNAEFVRFEKDLQANWHVAPALISARLADLKSIFRKYLALSCTAASMSDSASRPGYLSVVAETGYLSMVLALRGAQNTSMVLTRQTIELVLKHIYYAQHPVEHAWAQRRTGYREITFQFLIEYLRSMEELELLPKHDDVIAVLLDWYAKLSVHVHVHNARHLGFPEINSPPATTSASIDSLRAASDELWPVLVLLMRVFCDDQYLAMSEREKDLARSCFPSGLKGQCRAWEYSFASHRPLRS
jgi:hypothetical protein